MRHLITFIALNIPAACVVAYAAHRGANLELVVDFFHRVFF